MMQNTPGKYFFRLKAVIVDTDAESLVSSRNDHFRVHDKIRGCALSQSIMYK